MTIVQINTSCGIGSTGKICVAVSQLLNEKNVENYILFSATTNGYEQGVGCSTRQYIKMQALKSRMLGNYGFNSNRATKKMIAELESIKPDVVHLHNIHGHDGNLETLLDYLKKKNIKVYWTFHDCWAFTGYCTYFTMMKCEKWKTGCKQCDLYKSYSWFFDRSASLYDRKKKAIEGLDLTIITPSQWLADLVKSSFLKIYPVKVINNGIDLGVFKPTYGDFLKNHNIEGKKVVLCVANEWEKRKGLDVLVELSKRLPNDYQLVLVGTNDRIDRELPSSIIFIHRTSNQRELAEIYTAADVFVNPTREDNYPTVNLEAIACGTPVVTFRTGGSPESIIEGVNGFVVDCDDVDAMESAIVKVCTMESSMEEGCLASAKRFNMHDRFAEYVALYR